MSAPPSSTRIVSPVALSATTVARHAARPSRRRAYSARKTARGNPMNSPTNGMTKNPMIPPSPPHHSVEFGTSALVRWRAARKYFPTFAPTTASTATASTIHAGAPPVTNAHTTIAPSTKSEPGRICTTTPTSPSAMTSPTTTSPPGLMSRQSTPVAPVPARATFSNGLPEHRDGDIDDNEPRDPAEEPGRDALTTAPHHDER